MTNLLLFSGSANRPLAGAIAQLLGVPLAKSTVERFPDGEVGIVIDESVRRADVFVVQPTSPPVDTNLMELLVFADACRRAAAARVVAVVPYFGYARSDKRGGRREPIAASMVAHLLETAGVDHVITIDLHTQQIEGFFRLPVDNFSAIPLFCETLRSGLVPGTVVVAPDVGRVGAATQFAQMLRTEVVVVHKRRDSGSETAVTRIVGDVTGRHCLIIDDMISTGGTIVKTAAALRDAGAGAGLSVVATHGLFVDDARAKLAAAGVTTLVVTDSIPQLPDDRVQVVSVAPLLADAIRRIA